MKQKMFVCGVSRRQGISKKTGNQYDIAIVTTLQPQYGTDANYVASGFKVVEMQAPAVLVTQALSWAFPCTVDAELSIRNDGKLDIMSMAVLSKSNLAAAS
ncbi:MAG: hypothetical protein P1U47_13055 [Zhongshania sp.]|uniref:hypothetical protein n=1 Tax=Zhongshania sp. TaxID=1971902 RepID=UPI00262F0D81|nr:hypothetical protein [Zhongshania sp.]MDF1693291.1 hypothetical protein [Zhongshania sp.]MDF1693302.1 hypothetical protein [Zhongshania sp.]